MKPNILIVEDEKAIADSIQYVLESEGMRTSRLSLGKPALEALRKERFDLVILDIGLPDISGFDVCKEIRKEHTVPVVFLTARSGEIDRVVGLEIGGDDYVAKPFSPRELAARVKAVLRRTQENITPEKRSGLFEIDASKRQVRYAGKTLELSKYEYEILVVFVRRPGHVFSRDQLMDLVWTEPDTSTDRSVDAHIKNLRAKLKEARPDYDPIRTHRGSGYSLKEEP
jgi:two-component system, OmpR family, catabolic regulation response regulator CreB